MTFIGIYNYTYCFRPVQTRFKYKDDVSLRWFELADFKKAHVPLWWPMIPLCFSETLRHLDCPSHRPRPLLYIGLIFTAAVGTVNRSMETIQAWIRRLNPTKTQLIWHGTRPHLARVDYESLTKEYLVLPTPYCPSHPRPEAYMCPAH